MSESAEIGLQEIPKPPPALVRRLQEFDSRLHIRFNVQFRVWEIQEFLPRHGSYTHVCYWADGPWSEMRFRQLPFSADPLIVEVMKRDVMRTGGNLLKLIGELRERGAAERAKRLEQVNAMRRDKMRRYVAWAYDRAATLQRQFAVGGRSRTAAIQERLDVMKDLGLHPG